MLHVIQILIMGILSFLPEQDSAHPMLVGELSTFTYSGKLDSLSCTEYHALLDETNKFNIQQLDTAYAIIRAQNKVEYPCYSFSIQLQIEESITDLVQMPADCHWSRYCSEKHWVNSKIQIIKQRRLQSDFTETKTVYCRDDLRSR